MYKSIYLYMYDLFKLSHKTLKNLYSYICMSSHLSVFILCYCSYLSIYLSISFSRIYLSIFLSPFPVSIYLCIRCIAKSQGNINNWLQGNGSYWQLFKLANHLTVAPFFEWSNGTVGGGLCLTRSTSLLTWKNRYLRPLFLAPTRCVTKFAGKHFTLGRFFHCSRASKRIFSSFQRLS